MKKASILIILSLLALLLSGCVSQEDEYEELNAHITYGVQGMWVHVTNNETWSWQNIKMVLNGSYALFLEDMGAGDSWDVSVIRFKDDKDNSFDYLLEPCEKLIMTCEDPQGNLHSYIYYQEYDITAPRDTMPLHASFVQTGLENYRLAYEAAPERQEESHDALLILLTGQDPDYSKVEMAVEKYLTSIQAYVTAVKGYYHASILLAHTTPTDDGLLALDTDTIPFDRPDGQMYNWVQLEMEGESYNYLVNVTIRQLVQRGIEGQDVREELLSAIEQLESHSTARYNVYIGYEYYILNESLAKQTRFSDVLIRDCNPHCI